MEKGHSKKTFNCLLNFIKIDCFVDFIASCISVVSVSGGYIDIKS